MKNVVNQKVSSLKGYLAKATQGSVFIMLWPIAWYVSRAVDPKRLHHLLMGLYIPIFGYFLNNYNFEIGNYLCVKSGWLFCNNNPPTRPELVVWRNMYGVPVFIGFSLILINKCMRYIIKANRRLKFISQPKLQSMVGSWRCRFWWL
ncbi:hypothetical protein [Vogesella indigofera]|uniref:hypothetical protein n=1 Tax=Vogesella indigofera TaxID=45465 RepID=UPI001473427F|nr:hypothetical protein [Vogesella indigofera]